MTEASKELRTINIETNKGRLDDVNCLIWAIGRLPNIDFGLEKAVSTTDTVNILISDENDDNNEDDDKDNNNDRMMITNSCIIMMWLLLQHFL